MTQGKKKSHENKELLDIIARHKLNKGKKQGKVAKKFLLQITFLVI